MKISELPQEIREKALEYMEDGEMDNLASAFIWDNTKEGCDYWEYWCRKNPTPILEELILYAESTENIYLLNKLKEL